MLDAVAHVVVHLAFVVDPADAEGEDAVGDAKTLDEVFGLKLRVFVIDVLDGANDLFHGLEILRLVGESTAQVGHHFSCFHIFSEC